MASGKPGQSVGDKAAPKTFKTPEQLAAEERQRQMGSTLTPEQQAQNTAAYENRTGNAVPEQPWWEKGLTYIGDAATAGPARRLAGFASEGDWSNAAAQAGNMGGTPVGAHYMGQASGQPLAPNSGAYAPASTTPQSPKDFAGRIAGAATDIYTGQVYGQGLSNLANGGDQTGKGGGMAGSADISAMGNSILDYGKQAAGMYDASKNTALGYYGNATNIFNDTWGGGGGAGVQGSPALNTGQYSMVPGSQPLANRATQNNFTSTAPKPAASNPYAPPSQQGQYNQGVQQRAATPTAAQDYYAAYKPTTTNQGALADRQANGYGASAVADRYGDQSAHQYDPTSSGGMLDYLASYDPTAKGDAFSNQLQGANVGANAGTAQDRITSGSTQGGRLGTAVGSGKTASGQFINDLTSGNSATGQFGSYLNSGASDTGRFLSNFDPNQTAALGDVYKRIAAEGPSYAENFYTTQLAGENPAYNQLKSDFMKDQQRASAARGGFVSGHSMDLEQRGLTRLANEEFANRGTLAKNADTSRQGNLGLLNTAGNNLDTNLLARQGLVQKAGSEREGILGQLATNRDTVTGSTINSQEDLLGKLATAGDADYAKLASDRDANEMQRFDILGRTATAGDTNRLGLQNTRVTAAANNDTALQNRTNSLNDLANWTSQDTLDRGRMLDELTNNASLEGRANATTGGELARNVDIGANERETNLRLGAQGASQEQAGNMKERFDQSMRLGDSQSAISMAMDMAKIGALTQTQVASLNAQLAAMGVSSAERQALAAASAQDTAAFIKLGTSILSRIRSGSNSGATVQTTDYDGGAGM